MMGRTHEYRNLKGGEAAMENFPRELRHGSGATMTLDPTRLLLAFTEPVSPEEIQSRLDNLGLVLEDAQDTERYKQTHPFEFVNHTDRSYWVRSQTGEPIDQERFEALRNRLANGLDWIGPVYQLGTTQGRGGLVCPLPNVLLIRPTPEVTAPEGRERLESRLERHGLQEVREKSAYLGDYIYYVIPDVSDRNAYQLQDLLLEEEKDLIAEVHLENMPMVVPITAVPNDTFFPQQWSMTRIQAGGPGITGWDISTGAAGNVICVLDSGCDLTHPDLNFAPGAAGQGINLGTMMPTGAPTGSQNVRPHGTACAGLAVAIFNNAAGVAGVAGGCRLMPVAFQNWTDAEVAAGINWAAGNGAGVISMSFGHYAPGDGMLPASWNFAIINPAITNAVNVQGCVLVAATGNENTGVVNRYPARHPLVIAVGGSDQTDNRKTPASADGECWGANFGPGISVVAPCVLNPTTDIQGAGGYNVNNGGPRLVACVTYPNCGDAAGNYFFQFNGTSSATPHVAGLAGAIRSQYPALTNLQVRDLIERTTDKVGGAYADVAGFPNGTRNAQMGYGRINMFRALDLADALIKDWPGDIGVEPSTPPGGNFWSFSDIVVRITDDGVFDPGDPSRSSNVERGQTNYLYIRVTNNGSRDARNVVVSARITPYVGLEFVYPTDWTANDATHVSPTPVTATFASIPAGGSAMAKFTISSAQVDSLWGWISGMNWHPCLLASVNADNDYAFAAASLTGGGLVVRRNNLAQRNLSVIDVLASTAVTFPLLAGHVLNADPTMEIVVDRSRLPRTMPLLLALEDDGRAFPLVELRPTITPGEREEGAIVFLERTRIEATLGCCRGVLTLEKGSRFDCPLAVRVGKVSVQGGEVIIRDDQRFVEVRDEIAIIRMEKQPNQLYPLALRTTIPAEAGNGDTYSITVAQRNAGGETVGGATVIYSVE
jgi:subtilisin family serine protease